MNTGSLPSIGRSLLLILLLASIYFLAARLSLFLAFENSNATPVWPPSGIALAMLILLGYRAWPGIALGAFTVNVLVFLSNKACGVPDALWVSFLICIGNTLEGLIGYYLLKRFSNSHPFPHKTANVIKFVLIAMVMSLDSAAIGPLAVCLGKIVEWSEYPVVFFTWWTGDFVGIMVVTPLIVSWAKKNRVNWNWSKAIEATTLFLTLFLFSEIIFNQWPIAGVALSRSYLLLPFLLWAALRFELHVVTSAIAVASGVAVWGAMHGKGPFSMDSLNLSLLSLQGFISIISFTFLLLYVALDERRKAETDLKETHFKLNTLLKERTWELSVTKEEVGNYQQRMNNILNELYAHIGVKSETGQTINNKEDEFDTITTRLNALIEDLQAKTNYISENEKRINEIIDVLIQTAQLDFTKKIRITHRSDEIDAIALGLNTMSEELEFHVKELKDREEEIRLVIENIKDYAIILVDPDGNILSWNKGAERIEGYARHEIIGKHISVFYTEEEIENRDPWENLKRTRETGRLESEGWRIRKDGSRFYADVIFTALYDDKGSFRGFAKVTQDITERRNTQIELLNKSEELARSNTELEQFAYVASHDLQEPLRMISSYVQLLANRYKDKLDEDANDFIHFAVDGSNRMRTLINNLLDYSRINRIKPFEMIQTNKLLDEILKDFRQTIKENNAAVTVQKLPDINGDPVLMTQLFQNLISNAIKFKSDKDPQVVISGKETKDELVFSVKDNGIGIKKEYSDKIFVIFQRLHNKEQYPGTGIGLSVCKKIVEGHKGRIWVESEIGNGSTFNFTIKK